MYTLIYEIICFAFGLFVTNLNFVVLFFFLVDEMIRFEIVLGACATVFGKVETLKYEFHAPIHRCLTSKSYDFDAL